MLAALTAAESSDDLEVVQQLLKLGNVNSLSRQVMPPLVDDDLIKYYMIMCLETFCTWAVVQNNYD